MKRCLLCLSLLLAVVCASAAGYLLPLDGHRQYSVAMTIRGTQLSGLCLVRVSDEGYRGSIVNEFGIHALDFTLSPDRQRVRLYNLLPAMNRWYIKRVVRGDLKFLFNATQNPQRKGKRTVTVDSDQTVTLVNSKYRLKYSFLEINENDDEATE